MIHVLDRDAAGPAFGTKALAAPGGPLAGLDVTFQYQPYDWNDAAPLARLIDRLAELPSILAASSEGALFEYAGDEIVVANLEALRAGTSIVVGSVTRADEVTRRFIAKSRFTLMPRGAAGFAPLAARAGFAIARVEPALISDQVLVRPA
jgi:hypothetical protein